MKQEWRLNLQLFAGEKTEPATPKRRQEARKKGQVPKSAELSSALVLLSSIFLIYFLLPVPALSLLAFARETWSGLLVQDLDIAGASNLAWNLARQTGSVLLPLFAALVLVAWLSSLAQVGFLLTGRPMQPNLGRLNPLEGLKRLFSKRALVELLKSLLKLVGIGVIVYQSVNAAVLWTSSQYDADLGRSVSSLKLLIYKTALKVAAFLFAIGLLDYVYQRMEHAKSLRMSKQEIKEEYKQTEGDPQLKARIREKQRLLARRRMMQEVPKADVVIVNPTHLAIALKYDPKLADAPLVVAKGQGYVAAKIKEIARENRIAIVEDKPLARTLFQTAEIGEIIPPELYQTVAEVLAYVFRSNGRKL